MTSDTKITSSTPRKLPRPFKYHWGEGRIVEEASIKVGLIGGPASWEPSIQLLKYTSGGEQVRFCVYRGTRFTRGQFLAEEKELRALSREIKKSPGIHKMLLKLVR